MSQTKLLMQIDYREKKIITFLKNNKNFIDNKNIDNEKDIKNYNIYESINLELGDIIFNLHIDNIKEANLNNNKNFEIIIERKKISDLLSSIKDGRYKDQKNRVTEYLSQPNVNGVFYYLIEGIGSEILDDKKKIAMYHGSLISILMRDNIGILFTSSIEETNILLEKLYSRIKKNPSNFINIKSRCNLIKNKVNKVINDNNTNIEENKINIIENQVKKKKSDNITPDNCGILMLTYIPGMSVKIASSILNNYNNSLFTFLNFIKSELDLKKDKKDIIKVISNIKIEGYLKERKVGIIMAKKILEYLKF